MKRRARRDSFLIAIEITLLRRGEFFAICLADTLSVQRERSNSRTVRRASPHWRIRVQNRAYAFNLSHSHGLAVIAVGAGREVGIDVELLRPEFAGEDIAKRYFSAREVRELAQLPVGSRTEGFFRCWTRKEAYIKARGEGLHVPLDSFSVSLSPDRFPELLSADESRWKIESLVPSSEAERRYAAALVAEGKDWASRYFNWR